MNVFSPGKAAAIVFWCLLATLGTPQSARSQQRRDSLLNFDWKFSLQDDGAAQSPGYNDRNWQTVHLPHDASIAGAFDTLSGSRQNGYRPRHIGWYRKTFVLPKARGRRVQLEFEGVYRSAEVWINGRPLGRHLNGYTGFSYDISAYVRPGGENTIAVRYDNTYKLSSRWYTGEGIYRNVWLHLLDSVHLAEGGTFIATPLVTDSEARVAVQTEVVNQSAERRFLTLKTVLYTPDGKEVKTLSSTVPLAAGDTYTFRQQTALSSPQTWDLSTPRLYTAKSYVLEGARLLDEKDTRFGIRTVRFTPETGFLLNGRKVFLKGVNLHHDLGPLGAAALEKGFKRRLLGLKAMGCNAIRLAHNPHAQCVLELCDELGILVFDESFDKWKGEYYGPEDEFAQNWQPDLEWFIRRDRNHPSVFIWSVGNEVFGKKDFTDPSFTAQYQTMSAVVSRLDPSRKITSGLYPVREEEEPAPLAFQMDVVSDNYMSRFYKRDRARFPQLVFLESEMTTDNGGENFFNYDHSYACGQFYWGGTDYIGESFGWPSKGWNGIIDWCDYWKPISYYIKSLYSEDPMVKIAVFDAAHSEARVWNDVFMNQLKMTDSWNWQKGQKLTLFTFTTGDEVELLVNGKSLGVKRRKDFSKNKISWEVAYEPGTIRAVARKDGREIASDEIHTAGKPSRILLKTDSTHMVSNGLDLAYVEVRVADGNGHLVPDAENSIRFRLEGPADIAGVANGNRMSDELFVADSRKAYEGKCLLVLRSRREGGTVKVVAQSPGLKPATLQIQANP